MLTFSYIKHSLRFAFPARTSRGSIETHEAFYIKVCNGTQTGWGEASPLRGLSIDGGDDFEKNLTQILALLNQGANFEELDFNKLPAICFGIETALLDLKNGGKMSLFNSAFLNGEPIPINGLIWMADIPQMLADADKKVEAGFSCIKFKVGAQDFDEECRMLERVRKKFPARKIEIRLDANGAFHADEGLLKLKELYKYEIHSIEQPIAPGQVERMQEICAKSKIKIALDEELIGADPEFAGETLLSQIQPTYIILKPTLLGGFGKSDRWIECARKLNISWWATSALESNIGLNAIAQWCSSKNNALPQGLGTGSLYSNNITSPLTVKHGKLFFDKNKAWDFPSINF